MRDLPADQRKQYKEDRDALKKLGEPVMINDCFRLNPYVGHFEDALTTEQIAELEDRMIIRRDISVPLLEHEYLNRDQIDVMAGYI